MRASAECGRRCSPPWRSSSGCITHIKSSTSGSSSKLKWCIASCSPARSCRYVSSSADSCRPSATPSLTAVCLAGAPGRAPDRHPSGGLSVLRQDHPGGPRLSPRPGATKADLQLPAGSSPAHQHLRVPHADQFLLLAAHKWVGRQLGLKRDGFGFVIVCLILVDCVAFSFRWKAVSRKGAVYHVLETLQQWWQVHLQFCIVVVSNGLRRGP